MYMFYYASGGVSVKRGTVFQRFFSERISCRICHSNVLYVVLACVDAWEEYSPPIISCILTYISD